MKRLVCISLAIMLSTTGLIKSINLTQKLAFSTLSFVNNYVLGYVCVCLVVRVENLRKQSSQMDIHVHVLELHFSKTSYHHHPPPLHNTQMHDDTN